MYIYITTYKILSFIFGIYYGLGLVGAARDLCYNEYSEQITVTVGSVIGILVFALLPLFQWKALGISLSKIGDTLRIIMDIKIFQTKGKK